MKTSTEGKAFIKRYEKFRSKSYKCVPTEKLYTIGYGHYGVGADMVITKARGDEFFEKDVQRAESQVNKYQTRYNFNQNEFDALVSFVFNGCSIKELTDDGTRTKTEISKHMILYTKSSGTFLPGLLTRRLAEQKTFNTPIRC